MHGGGAGGAEHRERPESGGRSPAAQGTCPRVFPRDVCPCCPCLAGWLVVKDQLHLILLLGVLSSVGIVVMEIVEITSSTWSCQSPLCARQWMLAVLLFPTTCDFIKSMVAYDGTLQTYQERQEDAVNSLIDQINSQVSDMQDISGKLSESANDFAARTFNQSLQQFEQFVVNACRRNSNWHQDPELVDAMRTFIYKWFTVYCQSQLNQDQHPSVTGLKAELGRCKDAEAIGKEAKDRLSILKMAARIQTPARSFFLDRRQGQARAIVDGGLEDGAGGHAAAARAQSPNVRCGVQWAACGLQGPRARDGARAAQDWPLTLGFCCGALTILSRRHLNLLMYAAVDAVLICWELVHPQLQRYKTTMALLTVNVVCVISTLACFEQLDEIAKLQRRISTYHAMSEQMAKEFNEANDKWKRVQQLYDLWNYRTMPFLKIMGKIQDALDDKVRSNDLQLEWLNRANDSLEILDEKLGPASDWTEAGQQPLTREWKETIGRQLRNEERREDVDELIRFLPMLTNPQLSMLSSFRTPDAR